MGIAPAGSPRPGAAPSPQGVAVANSLGLPCLAHAECVIASRADLDAAIALARGDGRALLPLGGGSNVVLPARLDAVVLRAADDQLRVLEEDGDAVLLRAGAACDWHALVQATLARDFFGLENLALIPGAVGAAPVQNIGAYGRELHEFVTAVHGYDLDAGEARSLTREDCAFAYRNSIFKGELQDRFLITAVDLCLSRRPDLRIDYPSLAAQMESGAYATTPAGVCAAVVDLRRRRLPDPASHPNAGSFFKNPVLGPEALARFRRTHGDAPVHVLGDGSGKLSAAWLIERCGLRGFGLGRAGISPLHALVIENRGGAGQREILDLAVHVEAAVRRRFDVAIEPEPRIFRERAGS